MLDVGYGARATRRGDAWVVTDRLSGDLLLVMPASGDEGQDRVLIQKSLRRAARASLMWLAAQTPAEA
jgi:hypothetical protein